MIWLFTVQEITFPDHNWEFFDRSSYLKIRSFWHLLFVSHMEIKSKTDGFSSVINTNLKKIKTKLMVPGLNNLDLKGDIDFFVKQATCEKKKYCGPTITHNNCKLM